MSTSTNMTNYNVTVSRFDASYPVESPDSFIVGFTVTHKINGRSTYVDVRIPFPDASGMDDVKVVDLAWVRVEPSLQPWFDLATTQSPIVGTTYVPKTSQ